MVKISSDNKISILLQEESYSYKQLNDIKGQELSWLKNFMLFYSAIIAWSATRWLVNNQPICNDPNTLVQCIKNEEILVYTAIGLSFFATILFAYMFLRTRWSFYSALERLVDLQTALQLNNPALWGGKEPFKAKHIFEKITNLSTWRSVTKPTHGFGTRMIYILGANLTISFVGWRGLCNLNHNTSTYFFIACICANLLLFATFYFVDFMHFINKK